MAAQPKMSINSYEKRCRITALRLVVITAAISRNSDFGIEIPISEIVAKVCHNSRRLRGGLKPSAGLPWMIARVGKAPIRSTREHRPLASSALLRPAV